MEAIHNDLNFITEYNEGFSKAIILNKGEQELQDIFLEYQCMVIHQMGLEKSS